MFRRPAPGRPARQCGHPKAAQCDCLAKRTLCCVLTSEQWDQVEAGHQVHVQMYDTREELDAAQQRGALYSQPTSPFTPVSNGSFSSAPDPPLVPRSQMFGVGGPQGNAVPGPHPLNWTTDVPHVPIYQPSPQFQQFSPAHTPGIPGSVSQPPVPPVQWLQPRPEYLPFHQPQYLVGPETMRLEQMHLNPEMPISQPFVPPNFTTSPAAPFYQSVPLPAMRDFEMETETQFDPSQPPNPIQNVTQSCCSAKAPQRQQVHPFQNWTFPPSAPTQQFPCPRCASTMCTCTNCPEVMQDLNQNGAWSRQCGRDGHLDANEFIPPSAMPPPSVPKSCCGGGSSTGPSTAQGSPFPQPMHDAPLWPEVQHAEPQDPGVSFNTGMTVDPAIFLQSGDWHQMH